MSGSSSSGEGCFSVRVDPGAFPRLGRGRGYLVQGVGRRRVITGCDLEVLNPLGQGTAGAGAGRQLFPRRPVFRHVSRVGGGWETRVLVAREVE